MDLMVSTSSIQEGFCLIHRECNKLDVSARKTSNLRSKFPLGSRKRNRLVLVFAASKLDSTSSGLNGRAQKFDNPSSGNGHYSSVNSFAEDVESNNHLRQLVRAGELEEGFKFLENMVYHGNVPDIIPCTTLIRGFCRRSKTRKAAKKLKNIAELVFIDAPHELQFIYQNATPPSGFCNKKYAWLVSPDFDKPSETGWTVAECQFDPFQYQKQTEGFEKSNAPHFTYLVKTDK